MSMPRLKSCSYETHVGQVGFHGCPMSGFEMIAQTAFDIAVKREIQRAFRKRADAATSALIEALRIADVDPAEAAERDEVVAMMVAFYLAMAEGAAVRNLRLLARVHAGKAADRDARTDDFIMWKDAIAGLLHEEAVILATLHKHWRMATAYSIERGLDLDEGPLHNSVLPNVRAELTGPGMLFKGPADFTHAATAIARTGFVSVMPVWGGVSIVPTPRLAQLAKLADLQAWADEQAEAS